MYQTLYILYGALCPLIETVQLSHGWIGAVDKRERIRPNYLCFSLLRTYKFTCRQSRNPLLVIPTCLPACLPVLACRENSSYLSGTHGTTSVTASPSHRPRCPPRRKSRSSRSRSRRSSSGTSRGKGKRTRTQMPRSRRRRLSALFFLAAHPSGRPETSASKAAAVAAAGKPRRRHSPAP